MYITPYWFTNKEIADFSKTFYEPILRSVQEARADEAKVYFVFAVLILGGEGVGLL